MNVYLAKFMTYYEIHRMHREGHSISQISQYLGLNRRTVSKYLSMSEQEYEALLVSQSDRKKILLPYESFVKERLELYRDTSAAQMHDWLKEHHPDFPGVSAKTVFNFVSWVRVKHRLPVEKENRQYQIVEETPYGKQAQVDFGEYNMRTSLGGRTKVFFFAFLLSCSRYKYIWFTDRPFTSELAIQAHEKAFEYISGIPDEIVYDQDKVFIVSENYGDIILTEAFRSYTRNQSFALHFCRKADPQSKGKVENVVKYVKQNFLYNRIFHNLDTLNDEALGWLGRTANALPHAFTRKEPYSEWVLEQPFLKPYQKYVQPVLSFSSYQVKKNNVILYKGNLYSLPLGTFKGKDTYVTVQKKEDLLMISDRQTGKEICRHKVAPGKGGQVVNTDHKRDKSKAIEEMIDQLCCLFTDEQKARQWLNMIRKDKPRYIRDQLIIIRGVVPEAEEELLNKTLDYCLANSISSAADFKAILALFGPEPENTQQKVVRLNPLSGNPSKAAFVEPKKSDIEDYQAIVKKS